VTFQPGARSAWHTHPFGQTLIVTAGVGRIQRWGGPIEEIRPGDRVFFEPGEDHWHGAAPNRFMTHIAMLDVDDAGNPATWGEHVTDEEYAAALDRRLRRRGAGLEPAPAPARHCEPKSDLSVSSCASTLSTAQRM
jgi:hypothetical protein